MLQMVIFRAHHILVGMMQPPSALKRTRVLRGDDEDALGPSCELAST